MHTNKFWMVLGTGTPTYRHHSADSARNEAERLARQFPGETFVVLESIASVCKSDVQWEDHIDCSTVPF